MTARDIENDIKKSVGGASFITPGQLAAYLGQKNVTRVKNRYLNGVFRLEGTKSYFVPEIAKNLYASGDW